jgi:hypothetical protein
MNLHPLRDSMVKKCDRSTEALQSHWSRIALHASSSGILADYSLDPAGYLISVERTSGSLQ